MNSSAVRLLASGSLLALCVLPLRANDELELLVAEAMLHNPQVLATQRQVEQALADRDALRGFFDPQLAANASQTYDPSGYNQSRLNAGVTVAVLPGAYLGALAQESYFQNLQTSLAYSNTAADSLMQSLAGVHLGVPLLRDRGFLQWKFTDLQAFKKYCAARSRLLAVAQNLRHAVEGQYVAVLEARAFQQVSEAAVARSQKLLREAEDLVSLKSLPEYQVFSARVEVELRQEEATESRQVYENNLARLAETLGATELARAPTAAGAELIEWAEGLALPAGFSEADVLMARGDYAQLIFEIESVQADRERERDNLRSDLSLNVDATLQGENPDGPFGTERYLSERALGANIALAWTRPLGYRTARSRVHALNEVIGERRELLRQAALTIGTDRKIAQCRFARAQERLRLVAAAMAAARQALDAEEERFRLGEGRSRNVIDAQKDLTDTQRRQTVIAAELLRAHFDFLYACGYAIEETE